MTVLLVGRDPDRLREHAAPLLDRPAVSVETVADQSAAVDRLEAGRVDCLVATYDPGGGEGTAVLDHLREEGSDLPVVLLPSTRTTVIDSRNFVVDVESVVDPVDPTAPGDLAEEVVETVRGQRAAVAARRRHRIEAAGRRIADDADGADDEAAVAAAVAERLGDADVADGIRVVALGDDGPAVRAAAGEGAVPRDRLVGAIEAAFDAGGPATTAEGTTRIAAVPVETAAGDRWGVALADGSRYAFADPEVDALAALGETLERALSAVAARRARRSAPGVEGEPDAFAGLVEQLEVPVLAYDRTGLVHAASPGFGGLLGRDHGALEGEPVWELLAEPRFDAFEDHWAAFEEGDARTRTLSPGGERRQVVTTRVDLAGRPYNVVLAVAPAADADTGLAEVLAYELRHWMDVAEGTADETTGSVAERVESAMEAEVKASGSVSDLHVTAQPLGRVASEAWAEVLGDAGDSAVQGGTTVLADRTVLFRIFTHLFRTLLTYGEASSVDVGVHDAGFFVGDDGSTVPHDERGYADAADMTDVESGASIRVARRLATRHGWELAVGTNDRGGTRFEVRGVRTPRREVADREVRETQIGVLIRVLRHNLRNKLNVVAGNAELLADRLSGEEAAFFEHLCDATEDLVAVGDRASEFERLETRNDVGPVRVGLAATVERVAEEIAGEFPDAAVTTAVPEGLAVETYPDALEVVLGNLLRNAAEHADREHPRIEVSATRNDGAVEVAVRDHGPGIPDQELEVLSAGTETPLKHGSGLGLWIAKWGVQYLGGSLAFEESDPRGTTAIVTVPSTPPSRATPAQSDGSR